MAREPTNPLPDDLIRAYLSGESANALSKRFKISRRTVLRGLRGQGIPVRGVKTTDSIITDDELIAAYGRGESSKSIARRYGLHDGQLRKRMRRIGVEIRNISEAAMARYIGTDDAYRKAITRAAHDAVRGMPQSPERLAARAMHRQQTRRYVGRDEMDVVGRLAARGVEATPQLAVGPYNLDIGTESVAVEIWRHAGHPGTRAENRRRSEYLLGSGWSVLYVEITRNHPIGDACIDEVLAFLNLVRGFPSGRREYRVIRSDGHLLSRLAFEANDVPRIPAPEDAVDRCCV